MTGPVATARGSVTHHGTKTQLDCHCPRGPVGRFHSDFGRLVVDLWPAPTRSDQSIESRGRGSTSSSLSNAALGRWHFDCFADWWRRGIVLLREARAKASRAGRRVLCSVYARRKDCFGQFEITGGESAGRLCRVRTEPAARSFVKGHSAPATPIGKLFVPGEPPARKVLS